MLAYPQFGSAVAHFPVQKRYRTRTIVNDLADGRSIRLADPRAETTEWTLEYAGLSNEEARKLEQFVEETEGSLQEFTFLDPAGNLFAWSDRLDDAVWARDPFLTLTGGLPDPRGGNNAWHAANAGAAGQKLSQILQAPASYFYSLSLHVRSASTPSITFVHGQQRAERGVGADWSRIVFSASGQPADFIEFGIEVPAGGAVDLFGLQVEPQAAASVYQPSLLGGVYPKARFRERAFSITATAPNQHSATVTIVHAQRL